MGHRWPMHIVVSVSMSVACRQITRHSCVYRKPCMGAAVDDNESPLGARERIDKSCVTPEKVKRVLT